MVAVEVSVGPAMMDVRIEVTVRGCGSAAAGGGDWTAGGGGGGL